MKNSMLKCKNTLFNKIWVVMLLFFMASGLTGCISGNQSMRSPYTPPPESAGANPFVRIQATQKETSSDTEEARKTEKRIQAVNQPDNVGKKPAGKIDLKSPVYTESHEKTAFKRVTEPVKNLATQPFLPVQSQAVVQPSSDKREIEQVVRIRLAFDNADIYEVLDLTLYDLFGLSYMVDPTIKTTVTFNISGDYTRDQFINVLNHALQLNNLSIVKSSGNIYKILPKPSSPGSGAAPLTISDDTRTVGDITRLIRLRYVSAAAAATNITPFLSKGAQIVQDTVNNSLLITDTGENISKAIAILGVIDIEYFADISWQIFPVKEVDVSTIAADLDSVLKAGGLYKRQGAAEGSFEIFPIKSMNAILVVTRWPSILTLVQDWISAMDHMTDSEIDVFVYFVENGSAVDIANTLQQVFLGKSGSRSHAATSTSSPKTGSAATSTSSQKTGASAYATTRKKETIVKPSGSEVDKSARTDEFEGSIEIIPDEANNAIVFKASNRNYKRILSVLKKLDIQPRQVLINVIIAEISLSGSVEYGIEWFLNSSLEGKNTLNIGLDTKDRSRKINTPLGTASGFFVSLYDPVDFLRGLIFALGSDSDVNILSSPNILALDNKEAIIEVGSEVPTITGTTTSAVAGSTITNTVQYRKTGIILTVTPQINSGGLVKMNLAQEVSDIGEFIKELNNYIILTRKVETSLVVDNGQTIIIAGLMKSNNKNSQAGIPFFKDIPVLGYLFGGVSATTAKTELIIMITPHVIKNKTEADMITSEFSQKVRDIEERMKKK